MTRYECLQCSHPYQAHRRDGCAVTDCLYRKPCIRLTASEVVVCRAIAAGLTVKEVGLQCAQKTVQSHKTNLFRKLHVRNRQELTVLALRLGLITLRDIPTPDLTVAIPETALESGVPYDPDGHAQEEEVQSNIGLGGGRETGRLQEA